MAKPIGPQKAVKNPHIMITPGAEVELLLPSGGVHSWTPNTAFWYMDIMHALDASKAEIPNALTLTMADLIEMMTNATAALEAENRWGYMSYELLLQMFIFEGLSQEEAEEWASMWPEGIYIRFVNVGSHMQTLKWEPFYFDVNMTTGEQESDLSWLAGWNVYPMHWWHNKHRPPFPPKEYWLGEYFVCHGDWCMGCAMYDGNFRYRWWIYWNASPYLDLNAACVGGYFSFSSGSRDFGGMQAYGTAWVDWEVIGVDIHVTCQHHQGMIWRGPE